MSSSLDTLPYDLIYLISSCLGIHDYVHLSQTSRRYYSLLGTENLAKKALKSISPKCRQDLLTRSPGKGDQSAFEAVERLHHIQEAVARARPFSISVLAYGDIFCYSEGYLCYCDNDLIRILDIHSVSKKEKVIDVGRVLAGHGYGLEGHCSLALARTRITSISYAEEILVCVCEDSATDVSSLLVINTGDETVPDTFGGSKSDVGTFPMYHLACATKLFVRHNGSYLYYGTHSGERSDSHHEWLIEGIDLKNREIITKKPVQLKNFVGSDVGSNACFHIEGSDLLAVSNQTSFENEEITWSSFYNCLRIPLGEDSPVPQAHAFWQRQHEEGPINDSWTNFSLQRDQKTDELLIVECRKEWLGGSSACVRTYYTKPLDFDNDDEALQEYAFPANHPLAKTLDEDSKPHFMEPRKRIQKHFHREYESNLIGSQNGPPPRDYILAKSKFRSYNSPAMSFMDLVSEPIKIPGSVRMRDRLRLRVASRRPKSPLIDDPDVPGHFMPRKRELDDDDQPLEDSEEAFHPTRVRLWPPDNGPAELNDILCPSGRVRDVDAAADDRAIVYKTDPLPGATAKGSAIVMINFDPLWRHRGLNRLDVSKSAGSSPGSVEELRMSLSCPPSPLRGHSPRSGASEPTFDLDQEEEPRATKRQKIEEKRGLIWTEDARYLSVNRGYWLR